MSEKCLCTNATTKQRCTYKPKPPSLYCGVHKNCKKPIQPSPARVRQPSPSPRQGQHPPARVPKMLPHEIEIQTELLICRNQTTYSDIKINMLNTSDYKNYPACIFANIASFLPLDEAKALIPATGEVIIRHKDKEGNTYKNGLLHSYDDKPAVIWRGEQTWYRDGKIHRECDLPAYINSDSDKKWYKNGLLHRGGDKPAVIEGLIQVWYKNGKRHRDGDLPAVINPYRKAQEWHKNGLLHRESGKPAIIDDLGKRCYLNGKLVYSSKELQKYAQKLDKEAQKLKHKAQTLKKKAKAKKLEKQSEKLKEKAQKLKEKAKNYEEVALTDSEYDDSSEDSD